MSKEERLLILYFIIILVLAGLVLVIFFIAFQKRKNKMLLDRYEAQQKFQKEIERSKLEIQEQTFKNIAWELHDNVGQLLSVASMQLNKMLQITTVENQLHLKGELNETKTVVSESLQEIRNLSKLLNNDVVLKNGLIASLDLEIKRFNKLNFLEATFNIKGELVDIKSEHEIVIFRILQEFFSNVTKHAKASKLFVHLTYEEQALEIIAGDDGVGFDLETQNSNSGMETMKSRAELLKATFSISSKPGQGTLLTLTYPYQYE
ncbi:sensor histidine kinase [Cochleicola gelatinilyticus]|uniref:histidine kinase n=1 Tax=Cochleicola gelatinilyticus TaxID=1763537 RepID=A0A167HPD9_9FLAO|nr:histidine kinase [Cochleicola gelatinilyticus]OAB78823.1 histidine kinase [Cochleicola gelatinilyticus]